MANKIPNQNNLSGINTLAYMGTEASTPPQFVIEKRDPTVNDYKMFLLGTIWLTQGTQDIWVLVDKQNSVATWVNIGNGGEDFITDNGTAVAIDQTVNVFGGSNMHTEAVAPTGDTITINLIDHPVLAGGLTITPLASPGVVTTDVTGLFNTSNGTDRQIFVARSAGPKWVDLFSSNGTVIISDSIDPLHPDGINLQAVGGGGGGSVAGLKADDLTVATPDPVTGLIDLNGSDLIHTSAVNHTITATIEESLDAGDIIIGGGAGVDSAWGKLTSGGSTVAITYIPANTDPLITYPRINLEAAGGGGGIVEVDADSGVAVPAGGKINVVGSGGITTFAAGNTVTISTSSPAGPGANGMLMIGSQSGTPAWAHLTGAGGITITNSDGGITITGGGGGSSGISTFDLDNSVAIDTGTHVLNIEGSQYTTNIDHITYPYKNIYTTSPDPAGNVVYLSLASSIQLPLTNNGGTAGVIMIGTEDFMHSYGTQNTFLGSSAGNRTLSKTWASANTGVGYRALNGIHGTSTTQCNHNVAVGVRALEHTTATNGAVAIGYQSQYLNLGSDYNVSIGYKSLYNGGSGSNNIAIGNQAMFDMTTGSSNVAVGGLAMQNASSTSRSVAIGYNAMGPNLTIGSDSVAIGYNAYANSAGYNVVVGSSARAVGQSIAIGYRSLANCTGGSLNIAMGLDSGYNYAGAEAGNILIGNMGVLGDSGVTRIGGNSYLHVYGNNACYINGIYNKTLTGTYHTVGIDSNGKLGKVYTSNDVAFKANLTTNILNITGDGTKYYLGTKGVLTANPLYALIEEADIGSAFYGGDGDSSPTTFTAPYNGIYNLYASLRYYTLLPPPPPVQVSCPIYIEAYRGGVLNQQSDFTYPLPAPTAGVPQILSMPFTAQMVLQAGDVVKFAFDVTLSPAARYVGLVGNASAAYSRTYVSGNLLVQTP